MFLEFIFLNNVKWAATLCDHLKSYLMITIYWEWKCDITKDGLTDNDGKNGCVFTCQFWQIWHQRIATLFFYDWMLFFLNTKKTMQSINYNTDNKIIVYTIFVTFIVISAVQYSQFIRIFDMITVNIPFTHLF